MKKQNKRKMTHDEKMEMKFSAPTEREKMLVVDYVTKDKKTGKKRTGTALVSNYLMMIIGQKVKIRGRDLIIKSDMGQIKARVKRPRPLNDGEAVPTDLARIICKYKKKKNASVQDET